MKRAIRQKKTKKKKSSKISRPAKKSLSKSAIKKPRNKPAANAKLASKKAKKRAAKKPVKKARRPAPLAGKQRRKKKSGSAEAPSKQSSAPAIPESPHLLRQTKTTTAALALLGKGVELIYQKNFKKAKGELESLIELYPNELDILARARSYIQICDREEANLKRSQVSPDQLYALGILEHNKSNYDAAISYFLQSLHKHPKADYIFYSLAASHALKGDFAKAIEYLRKAIELNEDSRIYAKNDADFSSLLTKDEFVELIGMNQPSSTEAD